jgi:hypothetical protein
MFLKALWSASSIGVGDVVLATNRMKMTFYELLISIPLSSTGFQAGLMISTIDGGSGEVTMEMAVK